MGFWDRVIAARWGDDKQLGAVRMDQMSAALNTVDYPHHEIHEGDYYVASFTDTSMGDSDTFNVAFKTPSGTKRCHMWVQFRTKAGCHVDLWESPTWDQGSGAAVPIINANRGSSNTSGALENRQQATFTASSELMSNVTTLNTGSATDVRTIYSFGLAQGTPGGGRGANELVLSPDTQYALVFTADGGSNAGWVELEWYEHTDSF